MNESRKDLFENNADNLREALGRMVRESAPAAGWERKVMRSARRRRLWLRVSFATASATAAAAVAAVMIIVADKPLPEPQPQGVLIMPAIEYCDAATATPSSAARCIIFPQTDYSYTSMI